MRTRILFAPLPALTVCALSVALALPCPLRAQDAPPASAATEAPEEKLTEAQAERLRKVNEILNQITPKLDAESKDSLEAIRASMERVALDPDNAVESDIVLYKEMKKLALLSATRDPLPDDFVPLKTRIKKLAATTPTITAGERKRPGKKTGVGCVTLKVGDQQVELAQIPNAASGLSPAERAKQISKRVADAASADHLWFLKAKASIIRGQHVVAVPTAPGGYILTADAEFARLRGLTPRQLAKRLAADIRNTMDKPMGQRDPLTEAFSLYEQASAAYTTGKVADAEELYKAAIARKSDYLAAYEDLAGIYAERGDKEKLRDTVNAALGLPGLTEDDKTRLRGMLK